MNRLLTLLDAWPRAALAHTPTPVEYLSNLSAALGTDVHMKRDDCTGLAMGGNKARQLEYYLGEAREKRADTILITGAVQSNYVRMAAAAARKLGMQCHVQLEQRVAEMHKSYHESGNVLLDRLLGAELHHYPVGEDEVGADAEIERLAEALRARGANPYVIHLSTGYPPLGALGYVRAAVELTSQLETSSLSIDHIVVPSGSSHTHSGLLFGLRALGYSIPVTGICVRRPGAEQRERVVACTNGIGELLGLPNPVSDEDIVLFDGVLAPGYGQLNDAVREAMAVLAEHEGILLDPVYSGRTMAGLLSLLRAGEIEQSGRSLILHTGGTPALFGYMEKLGYGRKSEATR